MQGFLSGVLNQPEWLIYLITALIVFAEDALFVGFILPGETAAILGGVSAHYGHTSLVWMIVVVVAAAIIGDTVGFEVGKHFGPRLLSHGRLAGHAHRVESAQSFLRRRGGAAVFLGRWTAFFRAMMPALAGASRMHYPKFVTWNATGGIAWGTTVVVAGYLAGASYEKVAHQLGRGTAIVVAAVVIVGLAVWHFQRERTAAAE